LVSADFANEAFDRLIAATEPALRYQVLPDRRGVATLAKTQFDRLGETVRTNWWTERAGESEVLRCSTPHQTRWSPHSRWPVLRFLLLLFPSWKGFRGWGWGCRVGRFCRVRPGGHWAPANQLNPTKLLGDGGNNSAKGRPKERQTDLCRKSGFYVQPCQGEQQTRAKAQNSKHDGFRFECLDAASAHDEDGAVVNFEQLRLVLGGKLRVSENCLAFAEKLRYQFPAFLLPAPIG
jgi:hypothetical protein